MSNERPHHPYSPSWLQSGEACPHFQSRDSQHVRAIMGTIAHQVVETGEDDMRLSDDDAAAAAQCMDFFESRKAAMLAEIPTDLPAGTQLVTELRESYLEIDDCEYEDAKGTTAGYLDLALLNWNFTRAECFDWKFGFWHVEMADNNLQGFAYILGLFKRYKTLQSVRFYFKQPLLGYITHVDITRDDVVGIYLRIQVIVAKSREARARNDFSMARPHAGVCNFCKHIGVCPKVSEIALVVGAKFHPLAIPSDVTPSVLRQPSETSRALAIAGVLKVWCDAIKRQVTEKVLLQRIAIPEGHLLVESQKRHLMSMEKLKEAALKYLTAHEWESCLEASFGAVEGKIADAAPRGSKESTVKAFRENCLENGAVELGEKFSFLRPVSTRKNKQITE